MSQGSQLAEDTASFRPRLETGVDDPEVGSSGFGVGDLAVVIEIERFQRRLPVDITVLSLLVRGGLSGLWVIVVIHVASIADGGMLCAVRATWQLHGRDCCARSTRF